MGCCKSALAHWSDSLSLELARHNPLHCNPAVCLRSLFLLFHIHEALSAGRGGALLASLGRLKRSLLTWKISLLWQISPRHQLMSNMLYTGRKTEVTCQHHAVVLHLLSRAEPLVLVSQHGQKLPPKSDFH